MDTGPVETDPESPETMSVVAKVDPDERTVFGWAYVAKLADGTQVYDFSGDFVDDHTVLEKAAYDYVLDSRSGDVMHGGEVVASLIESVVFTPDKIEKMGLPAGSAPTAWWIGMKITDDDVWADVKAGRWKAWSIGGSGIRIPVTEA